MDFINIINDWLFKMKWLSDLATFIVDYVFKLDVKGKIGGSIHFFIYDTLKIFILLAVLIFIVSYIGSFFPPERVRKIAGNKSGILANLLGALLGTITPFCSCSSIPLFIGFTSAGLPIGVTFSFLISSPLVDLASFILLGSMFGYRVAISYVIIGVILAAISGTIISKLKLDRYVLPIAFKGKIIDEDNNKLTIKERMSFSINEVKSIIKRVWIYIIIGVLVGAVIHNWVPKSLLSLLLGANKWYSVILATTAGVPMYADIFGTLPVAEALLNKGVGIGTVTAFMMSTTALSLPSLILLKKVVKTKLLIYFTVIVTVGIIIIGYLFNYFSYLII